MGATDRSDRVLRKGTAFHGYTATIGPNQIRIKSIARNQRDGSIVVMAGAGTGGSSRSVSHQKSLSQSAPWLDVAQIELLPGAELVEIIEHRVFDHATRERLEVRRPQRGSRFVEPNVIHLYSLGSDLPRSVDLWLRVHSYERPDALGLLLPQGGDVVELDGCEFRINAIQSGFTGWSSADGFTPVTGTRHADSAIVLSCSGGDPDARFQVAAVRDDGTKSFVNRYIRPSSHGEKELAFSFPLPLDQITHFEIRPHGGRHRFFFDGSELPSRSQGAGTYTKAPKVVIRTYGMESSTRLTELAPLDVKIALLDGLPYRGARTGNSQADLLPSPDKYDHNIGTMSCLTIESKGLSEPTLDFRFRFRSNPDRWQSDSLIPYRNITTASSESHTVSMRGFEKPLKDIEAIEISIVQDDLP